MLRRGILAPANRAKRFRSRSHRFFAVPFTLHHNQHARCWTRRSATRARVARVIYCLPRAERRRLDDGYFGTTGSESDFCI